MRLIVAGGGTGGHIYPAVAVAKAMKKLLPSSNVLFLGCANGMEARIVPAEGLDFETIRSSGIVGKSLARAAKGAVDAAKGTADALRVVRRFAPDVVFGTGGYVSGPAVLAGRLCGVPCAVQEQNAIPGKTNQVLSKFSERVFLGWEYSRRFFPNQRKFLVTGNPIKEEIVGASPEEGRKFFELEDNGLSTVLLLGGSRGARTLVELGIRLARETKNRFNLVFITGQEYYARVLRELGLDDVNSINGARTGNIIIRPYVYRMDLAYSVSDLVICRAGGMTLAEVTACGLPALVIPSPNVAANHQEYNARALEEAGAAVVIRESGATVDEAADALGELIQDRARLAAMAEASGKLGNPHAATDIARELLRIARGQ